MKKITFLFLMNFFSSVSTAQWFWQNPLPQGNHLSDIEYISAEVGWAVGFYGTIIKTTDGGNSWSSQSSGTTEELTGVSFVDENTGYVVGRGIILKTTNGGTNWTTQLSGMEDLLSVDFIDENNGYAAGYLQILKTTNGGETWNSSIANGYWRAIAFSDINNGFAVGYGVGYGIIKTTNGGISWSELNTGTTQELYDICCLDSNNVVVVGNASILKTTDGGTTWIIKFNQMSVYDVFFADLYNGIALSGQNILHTTNGGDTWTVQQINYALTGVSFCDELNGICVGVNGATIKTTDGGITWIELCYGNDFRNFNRIFFSDSNNGIVVGDCGTILRTTNSGSDWISQNSGTTEHLYDVFFINANIGWAVGSSFTIIKTTDGGISWSTKYTGGSDYLVALSFYDENNGFAVGGGNSIVFKTTDGGENWTSQTLGAFGLSDVIFLDSVTALACGKYSTLYRTTNQGETWTGLYNSNLYNICELNFLDDKTGYASDIHGLHKTTDGGLNWSGPISNTGRLDAIHFLDINNGIALGDSIRITTNGGLSWSFQYSPTYFLLSDIFLTDINTGYIVGVNSAILKNINANTPVELISLTAIQSSNNVILSWSTAAEINNRGFEVERLFNNTYWIIVGFVDGNGTTEYINDYSLTDINPLAGKNIYRLKQIDYNGEYKIYGPVEVYVSIQDFSFPQNFPNPFNPQTIIKYTISKPEHVKIVVYDALGSEIEVLVNEVKSKGTYKIEFNAANLSSGVYYYQIITSENIQTRKMMLLK